MSSLPIQGILLDIDGVFHVSLSPLPGAVETLQWLASSGYPYLFVTNTTTAARTTLARSLQAAGLLLPFERILTAPIATANYIRQHYPGKRCWLITKGDTAADFTGIELTSERAEVVVIGGAEELLSYETMNRVFRLLMEGADLLAMHTNTYWKTRDGLQLDSGPFVHALELASGKKAIVLGKPSSTFFAQALQQINVPTYAAVMFGDDLENDVRAAQLAGLRGVLVASGKHGSDSPLLATIKPDGILASIAELPAWLVQHDGKNLPHGGG
jgi:HAD superfamily hydrolase (TIGR01458 family)